MAVDRALLLTPGASGGPDQPSLVATEKALAPVPVDRVGFGGSRSTPALIRTVREAAEALAQRAGLAQERVALGGRSMGGRMCSMAVADGLPALALVLISYPLHPPGRPGQLRTDHFPALSLPCLFVSGTRDAFGTPEELEGATAAIPGAVTQVWLDGGNHGLRGKDKAVAEAVRTWLLALA